MNIRARISLPLLLATAVCHFIFCSREDDPAAQSGIMNNNRPVFFPEPTGLVRTALNNQNVNWRSVNYDRFRIYYTKDTQEEDEIISIGDAAIEGYQNGLRMTQEEFSEGIHLFMIPDRDIMEECLGNRSSGWSEPDDNISMIIYTANDVDFVRKRIIRHEIFHVVTIKLWGWSETWLQEGSAIAYDGADVSDRMAAYLFQQGKLLPLNDLIEGFFKQEPGIAYLQCGMMFRYLLNRYGLISTRAIWQGGSAGMAKIIGRTPLEFENEWHRYLETIDIEGFEKSISDAFEQGSQAV